MAKTNNTATAAKTETTQEQGAKQELRPVTPKAALILVILAEGPKTRQEILAHAAARQIAIKLSGPDTTSYLGSLDPAKRAHWDADALDPKTSWNHVSLQGRDMVTYDPTTKQFTIRPEGRKVAQAVIKADPKRFKLGPMPEPVDA